MITSLRTWFESLFRSGFIRSVSVLAGGTALAQVLVALVLPLLTRLYTPGDFSLLAVYVSMLGIISVAACLRLEIAIPMPEHDQDAANLLILALCCSAIVGVATALAVVFFSGQIIELVAQPKLKSYLWMLPLGVWLTSSYAALQFWATRKKNFRLIAKTRLSQAVAGVGVQVGLGWAGIIPAGLLAGQTINSGGGIFGLLRDTLKHEREVLRLVTRRDMRRMLRRYDRFPKYSTLESLANSAGIQIPIIMIATSAFGPKAGLLMLAMRVMQAPMALVGNAVAQVYLSKAPEELREEKLAGFTSGIIGGLAKSGVGPLLFAGCVAPVAFPLLFGAKWSLAGVYVTWMTPWLVMQFLSSPVSMTLHVTNNQLAALFLQLLGLVLRVGAVALAVRVADDSVVEWYAVSGFVFYAIYLGVVARISGIPPRGLIRAIFSGAWMIGFWLVLAVIARWTLGLLVTSVGMV